MDIPLTDLKLQYENIKDEIDSAIKAVLNETDFILGHQVAILEEEIAKYSGTKFAIGVASGTDALVLSLAASGIGTGDEVITTPFTFIATAEAISRVGAKPVFVDVERDSGNIDVKNIGGYLKRTVVSHKPSAIKAIIPVHLYGLPCDMDSLMAVARQYNLKVIEDCAQSFGSEYKKKKAGSYGDAGCLSFFPGKSLGCYGDGGMVITNDEEIAKKAKMLRNHGSTTKYYYGMHGFNSRLDTLQASILRVKLKHIDKWIEKRINNATYYNRLLGNLPGITVPNTPINSKHGFNYYTMQIKKNRDLLQKNLKEKGIASAIYYPLCLHLQEVYKNLGYKLGDFPVAEQIQNEVLSLPMYPELTKEQIEQITNIVKEVSAKN